MLDVKSCRGADVDSDHYLVRGKLQVKFKAVEKIHAERKRIPAIENLRNQSKVEEFNLALHNRFSCLPVEEDLETQWSTIKETIKEVSSEVLGECLKVPPPASGVCGLQLLRHWIAERLALLDAKMSPLNLGLYYFL
jgi:hypothetical protein